MEVPASYPGSATLHMSLDLFTLAFFIFKTGITTLISKGFGIDEKHIQNIQPTVGT